MKTDSLSSSSLHFLCGIGGSIHGLLVDKALLGVMVALEVQEKYESERGAAYSLWRLRFWKIKRPKS